jgi:transmembrane sensor
MREPYNAKLLLQKYLDGKASQEEQAIVESWQLEFPLADHEVLGAEETAADLEEVRMNLLKLSGYRKPFRLWPRIAAAAALVLIVSGLYLYNRDTTSNDGVPYASNISPGGNKAYLILADGKRIALTDAANGTLARQAGVQITKTEDGQLVYTVLENKSAAALYNTIETPKGGQYQVSLPDGTRVWLNAASSLKYPASFSSVKERRVELSGEAYFEVAHNKAVPFIVTTDRQAVTVLGTHFDINSYANETRVKTTLLEGSVRVNALRPGTEPDLNGTVLKPNQQSVLTSGTISVQNVEGAYEIAWKNGFFMFNYENLEQVMMKISRWYDIDVRYEDEDVKQQIFLGTVSRFENISKVLNMLEKTGNVKFLIEGKIVKISKKQ